MGVGERRTVHMPPRIHIIQRVEHKSEPLEKIVVIGFVLDVAFGGLNPQIRVMWECEHCFTCHLGLRAFHMVVTEQELAVQI